MRALFVALLVLLVLPATAQKKSSSKPANVQAGTLAALDAAAATLTLKPKTGKDVIYRLTEKTKILRAKKTVEATEFKTGDAIVVRFRKSSVGPATLYDLCDKASWEWLTRVRKEATQVTIKELEDDTLHATEGADAAEIEYRISEKTAWFKAGKPATAAEYKAGDKVYVAPRMLPSGGLMAIAVSDTANGAATGQERAKSSVTGTVKVINVEKRAMNLHTAAGDDRELSIAQDCTVRMASRDVPLSTVRPGQSVTVHISRDDEGEQVASRITILTKKSAKKPKPVIKKLPVPGTAKP